MTNGSVGLDSLPERVKYGLDEVNGSEVDVGLDEVLSVEFDSVDGSEVGSGIEFESEDDSAVVGGGSGGISVGGGVDGG